MMQAQEHTRIFHGPGYTVTAHPKSGFFCQHLTDIFYDYTHGPYMFVCNCRVEVDIETCMTGECPDFVEEVVDLGS